MADGRDQPQPGDLIEIDRKGYQHWAIYVGDGYVIHVTGSRSTMFAKKGRVEKQLLKEVVGNDKWRVNNKYDRSHTPLPVKEIIQRAESWVGEKLPYNLLKCNCEHFVTMLRYGEELSDQAKSAVVGSSAGAVVGFLVTFAILL